MHRQHDPIEHEMLSKKNKHQDSSGAHQGRHQRGSGDRLLEGGNENHPEGNENHPDDVKDDDAAAEAAAAAAGGDALPTFKDQARDVGPNDPRLPPPHQRKTPEDDHDGDVENTVW